jgi:cyanate permease
MSVGVFLFNHGLNNWLVELLRIGGMTVETAGYWATLPTVVGIFGSLIIPRLATQKRRFAILIFLCGLALVASILLRLSDGFPLAAGLILQGIARSSMMTVLILTLVELPGIGESRTGVASGMFFSAAEIGGVLGPLGIGLLYDASGGFGSSLTALSCVASLLMLGAVILRRAAR